MEAEDPYQYLSVIESVTQQSHLPGLITGFAVLLILLIASAFISGSEIAFFSLSPGNINEISGKKSGMANQALRLISMPERLLGTILVANNLVNIGIVIISAWLSNRLFDFSDNPVAGFALQVAAITFILLLFGEILPKIYASRATVKFALIMALPLVIMEKIFRPVSIILVRLLRLFRRWKNSDIISKGDLKEAINIASESIREDEKILRGIVKFSNIYATEIMKPRIDVTAIDIKTPFGDVMPAIIDSGYSRIPVYRGTFDNVEGMLYVKDLLPHFHKPNSFNWQSLIRPPYFIPETKKINDLLEEFQTKKIHMAIVVDEYGGTSGIVTLEDILEEIMGEIPDESDPEHYDFKKIDDYTYLFEGKTQLNEFFKLFNIEEETFEDVRGDSDTLAGLILEMTGEIPKEGYTITWMKYKFTIESADKRRIKRLRVEVTGKRK